MSNTNRLEWLESLTVAQVRALGCQNRIEKWNTMPVALLISELYHYDGPLAHEGVANGQAED